MNAGKATSFLLIVALVSLHAGCKTEKPKPLAPPPPASVLNGAGSFNTNPVNGFGSGSTGFSGGTGTTGSSFGPLATVSTFDGTWQTGCLPDPNGNPTSSIQRWELASGTFKYTLTRYSNTTCSAPDLQQARSGTLTIAGPSTTVPGAANVNLMLATESTTLQSANRVATWNKSNFCGASDWGPNVPYDTLRCEDSKIIYDLWQSQATQMTQGLNDTGHGGATDATRPTALDPKTTYQKG